MTPDVLARFVRELEATVSRCTHLGGGPAAHAYLRNLIMPGKYWTVMLNPAKDEQLRMLLSLPSANYVFLQPMTFRRFDTPAPHEAKLMMIALLAKSKVSRQCLCTALSRAPMQRPERRRTLRQLPRAAM